MLDNIEHGSTRINQIVGNLREFVRERGKGERRRVDLKQVVEKGISICLGRIRKTVKTFESNIPEGTAGSVHRPAGDRAGSGEPSDQCHPGGGQRRFMGEADDNSAQ